MLASFLTTFLFSVSVLFASRSSGDLGGLSANLGRLFFATVFLGIWAFGWGGGFGGPGLSWFLLSGAIGFGMGDMGLFGALPRIGPRLAILLTQCLAAPLAGVVEFWMLGVQPGIEAVGFAVLILAGVALALAPEERWAGDPKMFRAGVAFGFLSALGQGLGAVFSRKGYAVAVAAGVPMDGGTVAFQRIVAGGIFTVAAWGIQSVFFGGESRVAGWHAWRKAWPSVLGNAFSGPTLGVACFQWALLTTPSATVLPVVATSPLVTMGLAWCFEGIRPSRRAIVGGIVAVAGAAGMAWYKAKAP